MFLYPLLAALLGAGIAGSAVSQGPASDSNAQQILARVRDAYARASAWHFEHRISIELVEGTAPPVVLVDVKVVTAIASKGRPAGVMAAPFCPDQCRLEATTAGGGTTLLIRDGVSTWLYSSARNEYMKGTTPTDVLTSVGGSMLLVPHMATLGVQREALTDVRQLPDEPVLMDGVRRDCYVVEAALTSNGLSLAAIGQRTSAEPSPALLLVPSGLLQMFQLQGLAPMGPTAAIYLGAEGVPPPRVHMWIDKERYLLLRRSTTQTAARIAADQMQLPRSQTPATTTVTLKLDDVFSRAEVGEAVQNSVFTFQPPAGAREIPNIRTKLP